MRAIEFRFWSGDKMFYMEDFDSFNSVLDCLKQQLMFEHEIEERHHRFLEGPYDHVGKHGASFMQYTGLQDAKGNKVYEGDILSYQSIGIRYSGQVVFGNYEIYEDGGLKITTPCFCLKFSDNSGYTDIGGIDTINFCIVVGNVYENPERLENAHGYRK